MMPQDQARFLAVELLGTGYSVSAFLPLLAIGASDAIQLAALISRAKDILLAGKHEHLLTVAKSSYFRDMFGIDRYGNRTADKPQIPTVIDEGPGTVTSKPEINRCGPDITDWLLAEMQSLRPRFTALKKKFGATSHGNYLMLLRAAEGNETALGFVLATLKSTSELLTKLELFAAASIHPSILNPKGKWDFKVATCPSPACSFTVTLCEHCYPADIAGNILFYVMGLYAGFDIATLQHGAVAFAGISRGTEDPLDVAAATMGSEVHKEFGSDSFERGGRKRLCDALNHVLAAQEKKLGKKLTRDMDWKTLLGCALCPYKFQEDKQLDPLVWK
jgi:hypothetical protein